MSASTGQRSFLTVHYYPLLSPFDPVKVKLDIMQNFLLLENIKFSNIQPTINYRSNSMALNFVVQSQGQMGGPSLPYKCDVRGPGIHSTKILLKAQPLARD